MKLYGLAYHMFQVMFVALKITGYIKQPWWIVLLLYELLMLIYILHWVCLKLIAYLEKRRFSKMSKEEQAQWRLSERLEQLSAAIKNK